MGSNSRVYRDKKLVFSSIFSGFEIEELRYHQAKLVPKGGRVIVFAYSLKREENERIADRLNANGNKCLYVLSASTLSWLSYCFRYSRIKYQQFNYLNSLSNSKNCLAIFGSFSDINRWGEIAFTDDDMLDEACRTFLSDLYGAHYFFKLRSRGGTKVSKLLSICIYFFLGVLIGSALIKATSNNIYGYNDAWFYKKNLKSKSAFSTIFPFILLLWSIMIPPAIIIFVINFL